MPPSLFGLARPALHLLGAEEAHEVTLRALEAGLYPRTSADTGDALGQQLWGMSFANPVGIAAGFDKDARVPDAVLGMGCGFAEIGTVTPQPQAGNPKPRVFRLGEDQAVINRLGFNNGGHAAALGRLERRLQRGIVGVNIGANKQTSDRAADYVAGLRAFNNVASYYAVNISSPNTPGLRDLQAPAELDALLARIMAARAELVDNGGPRRPIFVKVAPDIAEADVAAIAERLVAHGVDGIAVSNTTLSRPGLASPRAREAGGLSGRPLFHRSTVMLARFHQATSGKVPLIGIGGIDSGAAALSKIEAGARLLQLYTGLIFRGPTLIGEIKSELARAVAAAGCGNIAALCGRRAAEWAARPLEG